MNTSKKLSAILMAAAVVFTLGANTIAATEDEEILIPDSSEKEENVTVVELEEPVAEPIYDEPALIYYPTTPSYVSVKSSTEKTDEAELNEKLAEVTLSVRNTIGIGDEYTSFNGNFSDNITNRMWYLYWSNDDNDINVTAAEDGTVVSYNKNYHTQYKYTYNSSNRFYSPKFQATTRDEAKESVKVFMRRVLNSNESYVLNESDYSIISPVSTSSYYFYGTLTVNGLETPVNINITVASDTLEVIRYSRNDFSDSYFGGYPSESPLYSKNNAFDSLSKKFSSTLKYYIVYDKDDTEFKYPKAQLQYRFNSTGDWYFDALTGETVNRNDLYDSIYGRSTNGYDNGFDVAEEAPAAEPGPTKNAGYELTEVELENIEKMKDVLKAEDIALKICEKYPEFGLQYFELASASYTRDVETDDVTASLYFTKKVTKGSEIGMSESAFRVRTNEEKNVYYIRKYINADGKTGDLFNYYTNYPYVSEKDRDSGKRTVDTIKAAEEFLSKNFPDEFGSSALTRTYTNDNALFTDYTYTHTVNGYPLDQNYLDVRINCIDGTVDTFSRSWVDGVEFESADGILSEQEALEKYTSEYYPKLQYITIPVAIDDKAPEFEPYVRSGWYSYVYSFKTAYVLARESYSYGVAAKSGDLLKYESGHTSERTQYTDIDNCASKDKIEKLADYGITFGGHEFQPTVLLTQKDMLVFLLNSVGCSISAESNKADNNDYIYSQAVYYGFIEEGFKDPDKLMRTEDVAKAIITPTEYGAAAALKGLFKADYADNKDITEGFAPYLIIADELGLISADADNCIRPCEVMTREGLAIIVYAFMDR